jgi:hypothetical protein
MNLPVLSVIVPAPDFRSSRSVREGLRRLAGDLPEFEVLVATGDHPARQRNAAVVQASGKILVFLDSDCIIEPAWAARLRELVQDPPVWDVVGGPILLEEGAGCPQAWFQTALSHPLLVGPTASRYAARGPFRRTGESELILANLIVRRKVWERHGEFDPELYPNEENEWLDRLGPDAQIMYDPQLAVRRPQRGGWGAFAWMGLRYGAGRTRQSLRQIRKRSRLVVNPKQAAPVIFLAALVMFLKFPQAMLLLAAAGAMVIALAVGLTLPPNVPSRNPWMVATAGVVLVAAYAAGQLLGFLGWPWNRRPPGSFVVYDHEGVEREYLRP